jgi:ribosomal protein S27AE
MTDEWNEELRCPECGKTGMARLSHPKGDQAPTVQKVPDGFKVISTQHGPDFHCGTCNIAVAP